MNHRTTVRLSYLLVLSPLVACVVFVAAALLGRVSA